MSTGPVYRRADPRVWDDDKFLSLSKDGKLLWLHLLTGPQASAVPGLILAGVGTLADGMREELPVIRAALAEIVKLRMAEVDEAHRVIRLPNAPRHNGCESPNGLKGWWSRWQSIPDCPLKFRHVASLEAAVPMQMRGMAETWASTFGALPEDLRSPFEAPSQPPTVAPSKPDAGTDAGAGAGTDAGVQRGSRPAAAPPPAARRAGSRKARELTDDAEEVQGAIAVCTGVLYPPASFDALEARFREGVTTEQAIAVVRFCAQDPFWCGQVKLDPATLFRPKHWPGLCAKAQAAAPKPFPFASRAPLPPEDPDSTWGRAAAVVEAAEPEASVYLGTVRELGLRGDELRLGVPNLFVRDHLLDHWGPQVRDALAAAAGRPLTVEWELREAPS